MLLNTVTVSSAAAVNAEITARELYLALIHDFDNIQNIIVITTTIIIIIVFSNS